MAHADHHDHAADAHDAHDDHHEPPPPPEPHTPGWFTMLGAVLFLVGGGIFLLKNAEPGAKGGARAEGDKPQAAAVRPPGAIEPVRIAPSQIQPPAQQVVVAQPAGPQGIGARPLPSGLLPQLRR